MSIKKIMRSVPSEPLAAKGLLYHDHDAIAPCQRECSRRLSLTIQLEQEAYLSQHPEIAAMMELFVCRMALQNKRHCNFLKEAADYFLQDASLLESDIRKQLKIPATGSYTQGKREPFKYEDMKLVKDLRKITAKHFPTISWSSVSSRTSAPQTESSSFLSVQTSATTIPTPEPVPTPPPTFSQTVFNWISNTVDKAIFLKVDTEAIYYDTAYVELMKAVEAAMEIPVIEIREDIGTLFYNAYKNFEDIIIEKERIAAEIAWEKRMRKKMKRTLRREKNFKGYETPVSPKSSNSSESCKPKAPPRPCKCHPQFHYNRYAKDRFGIYLPQDQEYSKNNVTVTPAISLESLLEDGNTTGGKIEDEISRQASATSTRTNASTKSNRSRKSTRSAMSGRAGVTIKSATSVKSFTQKNPTKSIRSEGTNKSGNSDASSVRGQ